MNFRQVHLDFHTSEKIPGIGSAFSKEQFQAALKEGHVNSITLFSKCHHGWAYHPSEANRMHPNLNFDLLGEQIKAAHEIGVKTPVYISAGLDEKEAREHSDWLIRQQNESTIWAEDFSQPGYHRFCFNTPYLDYLLLQIEEVVRDYDCDGIFLDIVAPVECYCQHCVKDMLDKGLNPYDADNAYRHSLEVYDNYTKRVREAIDKYKPGLPVFHNAGHISCGMRDHAYANTHLELESLPTGGWGYDHFPLSAAYARTIGLDFLGMTGKFHLSWGEFGGFKHPNALRYEAALSVANGAKVSIGDQLHPCGAMEPATYKLIGAAFSEIEKKEPWLDNVTAVTDIAILSEEAVFIYQNPGKSLPGRSTWRATTGAARVMLEGKYLFDVVDCEGDFSKYKLLILPDTVKVGPSLGDKLSDYTKAGGKLLATSQSGLKLESDKFAFDLGAKYLGKCEYCPAYLHPGFDLPDLWDSAYVIYNQASDIEACGKVISTKENPYFNRSVFSFSSHQHTPNNSEKEYPAITLGKNGIYCCFPLFAEYAEKGSLIAKEIAVYLIDMLLGNAKTLKTDLPAQGVVTLMEQKTDNRFVNHLLYASPVKRGNGKAEIIEDLIPIYNTSVSLKIAQKVKRVYLAPQNIDIDFEQKDGELKYTVDKFTCHQMVVINY